MSLAPHRLPHPIPPLMLRQLIAQLERNPRPCPTAAPKRFSWELRT